MPEFGMLSLFKKPKGNVEKKIPPIVENDITFHSLMSMLPVINDSDLVEVMGKKQILRDSIESTYERFRQSFNTIIKNMDEARLTVDDRSELAQSYLNKLEYLEQLVSRNDGDARYKHFSGRIRNLKEEVKARLTQ